MNIWTVDTPVSLIAVCTLYHQRPIVKPMMSVAFFATHTPRSVRITESETTSKKKGRNKE